MGQIRITGAQAVALIACLAFGKSIGLTTGALARLVAQDTWLASLFSFAGAFLLVVPLVALARRFPNQRVPEWVQVVLGKGLGGLVLLLLAFFLLGSYVLSAVTIELHLKDYLLTETPRPVFVIGLSALFLYAVYLGLEVIARLAIAGLGMALLLGFLVLIGAADRFDVTRMLPAWESGLLPIMQASSIAWTDSAMSLVGLLFLWPRTDAAPGRWLHLSWLAILLSTLTVIIWPVLEIGSMGAEVTGQYLIACMQLARTATLGIYLHRYELIMMVLFAWGTLIQNATLLYLGLESLRTIIPIKTGRGSFLFVGSLLLLPGQYLLTEDRHLLDHFHTYIWPVIALPIALGLPLLLWLVALVRRLPTPPPPPQAASGRGEC